MVEQHVFMICKALGSTHSTKIKSKFCLTFKEKFSFSQLRLLLYPVTHASVTLFFLSSYLLNFLLTFFIPDTMVSAKNPLVNNKRLPVLILGLAGD